jgi:hypothetical protein
MKDKTQRRNAGDTSSSDRVQGPAQGSEKRGRGHGRAITALGSVAAAGGVAAALLISSHGNAVHQESKPAQTRVLTPTEAAAQYKRLVSDTMHTSAGIIIDAYHKDPKDFKIVNGQGVDSKYELLETKDEQSAAVLLPASVGPNPQSKNAADAAYVHWAGVNTEGGITGEMYDITQDTQASIAASDLGVEMPTDFTTPEPQATAVAPGLQIEATDNNLFASSIDADPSPVPLRDAVLATDSMIANPPFNPGSGASKDLIAAAANEQSVLRTIQQVEG